MGDPPFYEPPEAWSPPWVSDQPRFCNALSPPTAVPAGLEMVAE